MKAIASIFALGSALVVVSTVLAADASSQPLTRAGCGQAGMRWNEGANVCTESPDASSQPLTRADCGKAGMPWNEGANVCTESTSTAARGESKPESTPGAKSSSVLITININETKNDGVYKRDKKI